MYCAYTVVLCTENVFFSVANHECPVEMEYNVSETGEAFAEIPVFCARKTVQSFCLDVTILANGGGQEAFGYHLHRDIR